MDLRNDQGANPYGPKVIECDALNEDPKNYLHKCDKPIVNYEAIFARNLN